MKTTLVFDGTHEIDLSSQLNLLAHAQCLEIDLGSQCGGHGVCGRDKVRIIDFESLRLSPITEAEREHLSAQELDQGYRLACQCYPDSMDSSIAVLSGVKKGGD